MVRSFSPPGAPGRRPALRRGALLCLLALLCLAGGCAPRPTPDGERSVSEIREELVMTYARGGETAEARVAELLAELAAADADAGARWEEILDVWRSCGDDLPIHYDVLPDGLPDTDELAIAALGFQLEPDGSMRPELTERLRVVLNSAEKYPRALIVCTGGGTAFGNRTVTEAGQMAVWLTEHGVSPDRVIVEDRSLTTAENAAFSLALLAERYPRVRQLAIVSSDYHVATGTLLFEAGSILRREEPEDDRIKVVSNAAWKAPSGSLSPLFQAGALIELSGDADTA